MKVGIITFTDGRERVAEVTREDCLGFQRRVSDWLRAEGHEPVEAQEVVWNYATAGDESRRLEAAGVDVVVFNFCVWSYPDFTAQAAEATSAPIMFLGNINPGFPGWVAFFASVGTMEEIGRPFGRILGDLKDPKVAAQAREFLARHAPNIRDAGMAAALSLRGQRYGEFDGPSMGMYTGHIDQSQWMEQFGIQVFHRSALDLAMRMEGVAEDRVQAGLEWLEASVRKIHWQEGRLTPGLEGTLARQVRLYLVIKDFCKLEGIDFCGLTGQLDWTEWDQWCIMDVPEALLNDVVDWEDDPKEPLICATECDSNGALTMQLLHQLTGTPVLFADLRHYHEDKDCYDLVNSGEHAPWLAKRSADWRENWGEVELYPAMDFYFRAGGASVQFFSAPEETVTFARMTRRSGEYQMHLFTGSFVSFGREEDERLAKMTAWEWPHAFARFDCSVDELGRSYASNHIHAVMGDYVGEMQAACEALGVEVIRLGA